MKAQKHMKWFESYFSAEKQETVLHSGKDLHMVFLHSFEHAEFVYNALISIIQMMRAA